MANAAWNPSQQDGGMNLSPVERITFRFRDTGPVSASPATMGVEMPGFHATQVFADEQWLLTGSLSFELEDMALDAIGFYRDATPAHTHDPNDPKRITGAHYKFQRTAEGTVMGSTWSAFAWVKPPGIGKTQAFSIYTTFAVIHAGFAGGFWPKNSYFTLERYRVGPMFKHKEMRQDVTVEP